jgi:hypothetical protein
VTRSYVRIFVVLNKFNMINPQKTFLAFGLCLQMIASVSSWAATTQAGTDERAFFDAVERPPIKPRQKLGGWFVSAESLLWRSALAVLSDKVASKLASADDCEMAMWVAARNEASRQSLNQVLVPFATEVMTSGLSPALSAFSIPGKILIAETLTLSIRLFNRSTFGMLETKNLPPEVLRTLLNISISYMAPHLTDDYFSQKLIEKALPPALHVMMSSLIEKEETVISRTETTNASSRNFGPRNGLPLVKVNVILVYSPYTHFVTIFVRGIGDKCPGNQLFILQYEVDKNALLINGTPKDRGPVDLTIYKTPVVTNSTDPLQTDRTVVRAATKPENQLIAVLMHDPNIGGSIIYPIAEHRAGRYQQPKGLKPQKFWIYEDQRVIGQFNVTNVSRSQVLGCFEPEVGLGKGTFHKSPQPAVEYLALSSQSPTNPAPKDRNILEKAGPFLAKIAKDAFEREISAAMNLKMRTLGRTTPKLEKIATYDLDKNGVPEIIASFSLPMQYNTSAESQYSVPSQTYTSKASITILARLPQSSPPEVLFKWYGCECEYPLNNVTVLVDVIDVDNDGKDELIFRNSCGEVTDYLIYEFRNYKPVEVFRGGQYGC